MKAVCSFGLLLMAVSGSLARPQRYSDFPSTTTSPRYQPISHHLYYGGQASGRENPHESNEDQDHYGGVAIDQSGQDRDSRQDGGLRDRSRGRNRFFEHRQHSKFANRRRGGQNRGQGWATRSTTTTTTTTEAPYVEYDVELEPGIQRGQDGIEGGNKLTYYGYREPARDCPEGWVRDIWGYCREIFHEERRDWDWWENIRNYVMRNQYSGHY